MEMSRLTRDGTAEPEPVSRDQILRHVRGQGNIIFPVQLTTSRIGNLTRLIHTLLYVMTIHTYIRAPSPVFIYGSRRVSASYRYLFMVSFLFIVFALFCFSFLLLLSKLCIFIFLYLTADGRPRAR